VQLRTSDLPDALNITSPEGFAYYALDPLRYTDAVRAWRSGPFFVIGIRSIGTVLSAVCATALGCGRMTVRPTGHPYDRELRLSAEERSRIREPIERGAHFFVVDEGPGLSGSSFLATAEALEREGVARERITLIGSHECDGSNLVARDVASRWRRYRFIAVAPATPPSGTRSFRDWDWRRESSVPEDQWPATWSQLTPPKCVSVDGDLFWKYEGIGHAGAQVRARARTLAAARFSPRLAADAHGFSGYSYVKGMPLSIRDWDDILSTRVAEYLAFRKTEFAATANPSVLREMVLHNVNALLGVELQDFVLDIADACICDARLMPHEWIRTDDGRVFKMDATMHGCDHFYPGPCDIAWDVAGTVIEWGLDGSREARFLAAYQELTRDRVRDRIAQYKLTYAAFRTSFAKMAAGAIPETAEADRFERAFTGSMDVLRREAQRFIRPKKVYSIA
jgi:hypothetical protein